MNKEKKKKSLGSELFKHFNTGISYFLPVIIAGGMLYSFTLIQELSLMDRSYRAISSGRISMISVKPDFP